MLSKSCTTHGTVFGRGTGGSANAVLADPITSPGDGISCAERTHALNKNTAGLKVPTTDSRRMKCRFVFIGGLRLITAPRKPAEKRPSRQSCDGPPDPSVFKKSSLGFWLRLPRANFSK